MIRVDADIGRDMQRALDQRAGIKRGVFHECPGCRLRVGAARPDGNQPGFRFDDVTIPRDDKGVVAIGDGEQGLKATEDAVCAPVLGKLHGSAREMPLMLFEFSFKTLEQRERVCGSAGETGQYLVLVEPPDLAGIALHDGSPERHLPIATKNHPPLTAHREDCSTVISFQAGRSLGKKMGTTMEADPPKAKGTAPFGCLGVNLALLFRSDQALPMRKKVDIADLKPGMYVSALDRPWTETPFLFQGLNIDSQEQIEELRRYCNYVFVDDLSSPRPAQERRIEIELFKKTAQNALEARSSQSRKIVAFEAEIQRIEGQYQKFMGVADNFMHDVRMGRSLDIGQVKDMVHEAVASILRNPDALICLTQLQGKSRSTALHSMRVAILSIAFAHHLQLPLGILHGIGIGALLHDVGKGQLPEELINKTGALTFAEEEQLKRHVELGVTTVAGTPGIPAEAIETVALHHERFDGSGYPDGIRKSPSVMGQITALVNHYDTMTSDGAGRTAISPHAALLHLYAQRDLLFERTLVEHFTQCVGIYPIGSLVQLSTGHVGVVTALNRTRFLRPKVALVVDDQGRRYTPPKIVDLADRSRDEAARPWEIKSVLPPANFDLISASELASLAADATR